MMTNSSCCCSLGRPRSLDSTHRDSVGWLRCDVFTHTLVRVRESRQWIECGKLWRERERKIRQRRKWESPMADGRALATSPKDSTHRLSSGERERWGNKLCRLRGLQCNSRKATIATCNSQARGCNKSTHFCTSAPSERKSWNFFAKCSRDLLEALKHTWANEQQQ